MFQRVRLAVLFLVNASITTATVPVVRMVRRGKAVASRFDGPPCSARDLSKRFWSYAVGLSYDAEQGCWWSVCIHGRSRYCRLLKTFVVVIGKSEHEAARRILM